MKVHSCILLELTEYTRLKRLKVDCPCGDTVKRNIVTLLSRLVHLEELHVYVSGKSDILVAAISALLRNTACLTSLVFRAHSQNNQLSQTFIHALAANSTLEYLEILGKWDTAEPPGPFWPYVKSVYIGGAMKEKVYALQSLLPLNHLTSVVIDLRERDQQLFDCMAKYIKETTVLREIILHVSNTAGDAPAACWEPLFESLSSNTSITYLWITGRDHFSYAGHLARTVGRSRFITQAFYEEYQPDWDPSGFVSPLSRELDENYNLLEVSLSETAKMECRNNVLLVQSQGSVQKELWPGETSWCRYSVSYTRLVRRQRTGESFAAASSFVRELAEKEGLAVEEVAKMLRSRLVSVDGMHDFMRLTSVVKKAVTCAPPVDGCSFQIQDLNVDCWRFVRRYLGFDDVKRCPVAKPDDPMVE
ncbi:hypothetical protein MRX96_014169 [Rhipicephalus microplus]